MNITITKGRLAAAIAAVVLLIPATAVAIHVFDDVPDGEYFSDPVEWAFDTGVTTGKTPSTFDPDGTTLRKEVVTFEKRLYDLLIKNEMAMFDFAQAGFGVSDATSTLTPLPDASNTVTIPGGHTGRLELTFTAESSCFGGTGTGLFLFVFNGPWCEIHFLVDGVDVYGGGAAFDSVDKDTNANTTGDETTNSWEGQSATFVTDVLPAGEHTVTVEYRGVGATPPTFRIGDWSLTTQARYASAWAPS